MPDPVRKDNVGYLPNVPAAVRAQAAAATAAQAEAYPDASAATTTVVGGEPAQPPAQAPAQVPAASPAEDWEQRFRSLEGRFNERVSAARTAEAEAQRLQTQLAETHMRLAAQSAAPAPAAGTAAPNADDAEWGGELMAAARRQARAETAADFATLQQRLAQVEQRTQAAAATAGQASVQQTLAAAVGADWNTINNDPAFLAWLAEVDGFSGVRRHDLMNTAFQKGDGLRVAAFFNAFRAQHTAPASQAAPTHTPAGAGTVRLEDLAAPGTGHPTSSGAAPGKGWITQKEIAQFYSDVGKGRYRNNQAGKDAREAEIFSATREGRLSP